MDDEVKKDLEQCYRMIHTAKKPKTKKKQNRKEASSAELRQYRNQFGEAKQNEIKSWIDNEVYELVDMRKLEVKNYVTGRWVLTVKTDQHGNLQKCKARWVLRGFQDKEKEFQQTDSPASTRPGFRMSCQMAANRNWNFMHIDLKTTFLRGDAPVKPGVLSVSCLRRQDNLRGWEDASCGPPTD